MSVVGIDVDDTVAAMLPVWLERYNRDSGDSLTINDVTSWNISKFVKIGWEKRVYDYIRDPSFYDDVRPINGALSAVETFRRYGHRVVFITHSLRQVSGVKLRWLAKYGFLDLDLYDDSSSDYYEAADKSLIMTPVLIDDNPLNILKHRGPHGFLFKQPHNAEAVDTIVAIRQLNGLSDRQTAVYGKAIIDGWADASVVKVLDALINHDRYAK